LSAALLRETLEKGGYRVGIASNGQEGFDAALREPPALIISDAIMPVMDGFEMCRAIKKDKATEDIPVMLLTSLSGAGDMLKALSAGADYYMPKPYDDEEMLAKVKAITTTNGRLDNKPSERCVEMDYHGNTFTITASRVAMLRFMLSGYEHMVSQNKTLEKKVVERTRLFKESEERLRAVMEHATDAVIAIEPVDRIYLWNKRAEALFGYASEEAVGKSAHDLLCPERYKSHAHEGLKVFSETGMGNVIGKTLELEALRRDGTEFPIEISVTAVSMNGAWNALGIIRDITGRKAEEIEKNRTLDELERINRLMVGRELRMEELRKEVRSLRERVVAFDAEKAAGRG
ncbi:MAG: PAS domain S-box protein, partial [Deltaproteobacteria bacterium]|nr:PAS domain S-box protein [Deltaproteobacteria bacterium]